eukprot:4017563-Amphidinium_carterae.1
MGNAAIGERCCCGSMDSMSKDSEETEVKSVDPVPVLCDSEFAEADETFPEEEPERPSLPETVGQRRGAPGKAKRLRQFAVTCPVDHEP